MLQQRRYWVTNKSRLVAETRWAGWFGDGVWVWVWV
jgi:hypothetical protein